MTETAEAEKTNEKSKTSDTAKKPHEEILDSAHKIWLAGLGAMTVAEEEGTRFFKKLVEKGEEFESRTKDHFQDVREKAENQVEKLGDTVDDQVTKALERLGVPSRADIESLSERVDELARKVDELKSARD